MDPLTISISEENPIIEIEAAGSLRIKGTDDLEISVKTGSPEETILEQTDDLVRLSSPGDCRVLVPRQARLRIKSLAGRGIIKAVEGDIEVIKASDSLTLRTVGSVLVGEVAARLEAKNIMGNFEVSKVKGNLVVRDVQGDCKIESVSGNLVLDDVDGSVDATSRGNATLRFDPAPGEDYIVKANGNLTCSLPDDISARIEIPKASRFMVNFPEVEIEEVGSAPHTVTLGDGDAKIVFEASGNVMINSQVPDWQVPEFQFGEDLSASAETFAEQITGQIEGQLQMLDQQLNAQLANLNLTLGASGISQEKIDQFQQRARDAGQKFSERAQEKLEKAQERLEKKLERAHRSAERQARITEKRARVAAARAQRRQSRGQKAAPVHEPVQEEERLMVLKMLQEKKISPKEAESLLSSLEG